MCLIKACLHRSWCMFTLSADGGICAECRPAESLLRQRQLGGQMQGGSCCCWFVQMWSWRRLWRTTGTDSDKQQPTAADDDEDGPEPSQEMGARGQDHPHPAGTCECRQAAVATGQLCAGPHLAARPS